MVIRNSSKALLFAAALPAFLFAGAAGAATATDTSAATNVDELVVTAQRRAEPLLDVPATITAVSGDTLRNMGVSDMKSIIARVPNATLPDDSENFETFINIRGVHQSDINAEPNFGLYRNGIFNGGERGNLGAQIDIDRVEVLSGPQSGLYGRDAVGGAINVVYATPSMDSLKGYVIGSYGNWERSELQGAVNIPLLPNFAIRATGWWIDQKQGQLFDESLNQYIDRSRDEGGRLSAKWNATDKLSFLWMAEVENKTGPSFEAFTPNGITDQFGVNCCGFPSTGPETFKTIQEDTPNVEHWAQTYLSQDITYDTGTPWGTFEFQGAYRNYHLYLQEDQDHTAFGPETFPMDIQQVQYRNERLHNFYGQLLWKSPTDQKFTWIVGADYFNETFVFDRIFVGTLDVNLLNTPFSSATFDYGNLLCSFLMAPFDGGCEADGASPGLPGAGTGKFPFVFPSIGVQTAGNAFGLPGSQIDSQDESAFVTATYHVTPALSITGDLRWDRQQKHLDYSQGPAAGFGATAIGASYLDPIFAQIFPPFTLVQTNVFNNIAPSVNVQYKFNQNANVYALFATGFRAGGFNITTTSPQFIPYGAEKDYNYELGTKTLWDNGKLAVNADVFFMRQTNLLDTEADPNTPAFLDLFFLANVGTANTYGAEFQADYQPRSWLDLGVTVGWLDAKIVGGSSNGVSLVGQQIPNTRDWTINMDAALNYPLTDKVNLVGDMNWRLEYGGFLPASISTLETTKYDNLDKLDFDLGFAFRQTRVVGFMNNAFNSVIAQFQYADGAENFNLGRSFGVRIETKF